MTVRVLLFASYADVLGSATLDVDVPDEATVGDVLASVRALPGTERLPPAPLMVVNQRYATAATRVGRNDEVAIIPPVAGG